MYIYILCAYIASPPAAQQQRVVPETDIFPNRHRNPTPEPETAVMKKGASQAKELIFTARRLGAAEAHQLGLANRLVDAGGTAEEALSMAGEIASRGPLAVRAAKLAIDQGLVMVRRYGFLIL